MDMKVRTPSVFDRVRSTWNGVYARLRGDRNDDLSPPAPVEESQRLIDGERGVDIHTVAGSVHGIHNILKYDQYDPDKGLFYNDDSIAFAFDVLPQTGADDDMMARMTQLFTPIPPGCGVQWIMIGSPIHDALFQDYIDLRHAAVDNGQTDPFFVEAAQRRIAHLSRGKGRPIFPNQNFTVKTARLIFTVTRPGKPTDRKLVQEMWNLKDTMRAQLRTCKLPGVEMDAADMIRIVAPLLHPQMMFSADPQPEVVYDPERSLRDQITPFGGHVRVHNDGIEFGAPAREGEFEPEPQIMGRAFGILHYPQKKELWEMGSVIGQMFDDTLQYPCPFVICGGMFTLDPAEVDAKAMLKSVMTKKNARSKMAEYQPELALQAQDWEIVVQQIERGGGLIELYHTLFLYAPPELMVRATQVARTLWRSERFSILPLKSLHLPALYASLPMTFTDKALRDLKTLRIVSRKTTVNAVDMAPVIGEWRGAGKPVLMFFGRRGGPVPLDFYSNDQGNYNSFVSGVSGSGKSVLMNEIVSGYRGIGARVWIIDVGRSYENLIRLQKGTFLEFKTSRPIRMNPFTWVGSDPDISFADELRMLKPMIGRMASANEELSDYRYTLLEEAITAVWNDYGPATDPTKIAAYLMEKVKDQRGEIERHAYELGRQLHPFTKDGIYGAFFNGPADIRLDGDMVGLELEELKDADELRRVVMFVLMSRIQHEMYLTRDRRKLCLIDEGWQLLGSDSETAGFIQDGFRRARKYNGMFCLGTQSIKDAFANDAAEAAYNNADWKIFLRQDDKALSKLIADEVVSFSPAVRRMLASLNTQAGQYSELLVSSPDGDAVVRHIPDPFALLSASSKAQDFEAIRALTATGMDTATAIATILKQRGIR